MDSSTNTHSDGQALVLSHTNKDLLQLLDAHQQKVDDELGIYKNSDPAVRKTSLREQYNRKILEQDNLGKVKYKSSPFPEQISVSYYSK